ncbi:MAG: hypothetical protein FWB86_14235 [Treponema sp.]|nr:hypothetical protein [Treponema sp.]MCL2251305.1 hypothetical protein [Treponema sp.]
MQSSALFELIKQVVTSWQVIAVTVAVILFLNLIFSITRGRRNSFKIQKMTPKKKTKENKKAESTEIITTEDDDDLGLEEA